MKSIRQKAKAYDNAIKVAKSKWHYRNHRCYVDVSELFPELVESEDEIIRKELLEHCKKQANLYNQAGTKCSQIQSWISWLEKLKVFTEHGDGLYNFVNSEFIYVGNPACDNVSLLEEQNEQKDNLSAQEAMDIAVAKCFDEQKPVDNIEPKFKVGDWIVTDKSHIWLIDKDCSTTGYSYRLISQNGKVEVGDYNIVDEHAHLWAIQDAKDGDVLAESKRDIILMFRRIGNIEWDDVIDYYCYYDCYRKDFIVQKAVEYWGNIDDNQLKPATKEQRELLFQKMKEVGYEWDIEKKKLKKIKNRPLLSNLFNAEYERGKADALQSIEWSEEDKDYYDAIIAKLEVTKDDAALTDNQMEFLKSLKQRIGGSYD